MMEIMIAVGLGAWFTLATAVSCLALFKSFKGDESQKKESEEE